ncbi:MAG: hypothetical protein K8R77_00340 [Anaerolineaceae bacterium]|nr:hypothetical protein [Anaerolineaceae bacterium]
MNRSANLFKLSAALCIAVMWIVIPLTSAAGADIGPKPTMSFTFVAAEGMSYLLVMDGTLLECEDAACIQCKPLEELGPQGFTEKSLGSPLLTCAAPNAVRCKC